MVDLEEAFGATMEVGIQTRLSIPKTEMIKARVKARRQVVSCTSCELRARCNGPVPMRGPEDMDEMGCAKVLVVGEAPGAQEDKRGRPFVGPAGKLMNALMHQAGFDMGAVSWCNVVSCLSDGPPTMDQRRACRRNLRDQVVASGAEYVILAGSTACDAWRSDIKVSDKHGIVGLWGGMWVVMATWHPAAALRTPGLKGELLHDLEKFAGVVSRDEKVSALGRECVRCGDHGEHYDPDGLAYCQRHWMKWGGQWKKEMERWSNDRGVPRIRKSHRVIDGQQTLV